MIFTKNITGFTLGVALLILSGCSKEDDPMGMEIPSTYSFERNGESTVNYTGQTDRLNMLAEIKSYLQSGDAGSALSLQNLDNMFANQNSPFQDPALNISTKTLETKTFVSDINFYKNLFVAVETVSTEVASNGTLASNGVAGKIERGNSGNFVLVNEKGWEFTQLIEKGIMGSVFYHQIYNVYLTDSKIGSQIDNETLVEGTNYTAKEHHFDEAFGYLGMPEDFPTVLPVAYDRYWAKYAYGREALLGTVTNLKNAFLKGRTAIVNDNQTELEAARTTIYETLEIIAAATAIHYINTSIAAAQNNDLGNLFHYASEGYAFVKALRLNPYSAISADDINSILTSDFGTDGNFWTLTIDGLNTAKSRLTTAYPELLAIANEL